MADDRVSAALAAVGGRSAAARTDGSSELADRTQLWRTSAEDVPFLVAALTVALERSGHQLADGICLACSDLGAGTDDEPCEVRAVVGAALPGEGGADAG